MGTQGPPSVSRTAHGGSCQSVRMEPEPEAAGVSTFQFTKSHVNRRKETFMLHFYQMRSDDSKLLFQLGSHQKRRLEAQKKLQVSHHDNTNAKTVKKKQQSCCENGKKVFMYLLKKNIYIYIKYKK